MTLVGETIAAMVLGRLWRSPGAVALPRCLAWSADGRLLLVPTTGGLLLANRVRAVRIPSGDRAVAAGWAALGGRGAAPGERPEPRDRGARPRRDPGPAGVRDDRPAGLPHVVAGRRPRARAVERGGRVAARPGRAGRTGRTRHRRDLAGEAAVRRRADGARLVLRLTRRPAATRPAGRRALRRRARRGSGRRTSSRRARRGSTRRPSRTRT